MTQYFQSWVLTEITRTPIGKEICTLQCTAALFTVATIWKPPKRLICRPMGKEAVGRV